MSKVFDLSSVVPLDKTTELNTVFDIEKDLALKQHIPLIKDTIQHIFLILELKDREIKIEDIKTVILKTMEYIENNTNVKGEIKQKLVIVITEELINKYVTNVQIKEFMLTLVDAMIVDIITLVIDASKGKLDLNKSKIKKMFKCC